MLMSFVLTSVQTREILQSVSAPLVKTSGESQRARTKQNMNLKTSPESRQLGFQQNVSDRTEAEVGIPHGVT